MLIHCRDCDARFRGERNAIGAILTCPACNSRIKIKDRQLSMTTQIRHSTFWVYANSFLIGVLLVTILSYLLDRPFLNSQ